MTRTLTRRQALAAAGAARSATASPGRPGPARATGGPSAWSCTPPPATSGPRSSASACTTTWPRRRPARAGCGPGQLGVLGWSMGGAGALRLAEAHPGRLAAVVATSPAVAAAGAEVAAAGRLAGVAVKVDCGANDPFAPATRALAAALPGAEVAVAKGCHDGAFWQRQAPAQLRFLAAAFGG
jgi:S-formylglutathione hydrolase FrmB